MKIMETKRKPRNNMLMLENKKAGGLLPLQTVYGAKSLAKLH